MSSSTDYAQCRETLKGGSRSFHLASRLLPDRVRTPAAVLYAFCREADDLVDEGGGISALRILHARLDRLALAGSGAGPRDGLLPRDALLGDVLARHEIPREVLAGLLDGFAWDVEGRQYREVEDLLAYAMRVAGTVGLAMALVMRVRGRRALLSASALGLAMQLTNICRDVAEDARLGRVYLPLRWMEEEGIDPQQWLLAPHASPALNRVVARVLDLADAFYAVGLEGVPSLPGDCQSGIGLARRLYAGIGHRLRRLGGDPMQGRTVVPLWEKLACLVRPDPARPSPAHIQVAERAGELVAMPFLAAFPSHLLHVEPVRPPEQARVVWVLELFERLERRSIALRTGEGDVQA